MFVFVCAYDLVQCGILTLDDRSSIEMDYGKSSCLLAESMENGSGNTKKCSLNRTSSQNERKNSAMTMKNSTAHSYMHHTRYIFHAIYRWSL